MRSDADRLSDILEAIAKIRERITDSTEGVHPIPRCSSVSIRGHLLVPTRQVVTVASPPGPLVDTCKI